MPIVSQLLRQTREQKGISLEQVASSTYIKLPYLEALEADRTEGLPAPVYVHGYIRQYAKLLGLDGSELVLRYQQEASAAPVAVAAPQARPQIRNLPSVDATPALEVAPVGLGTSRQAEQVLTMAQQEAEAMKLAAERYADQILAQLEAEVHRTLQTIRNGRTLLRERLCVEPRIA